jgi:hypothetical protein
MRSLHIALDVEGVLADSHAATAERSELLDESTCPPPDWDFPSDDHYDEFMHVSQNLWHNHNYTIPPTEDGLWKAVRRMNRVHDVDIVTHRSNVDAQVKEWLAGYNIDYDDIHFADGHKTQVGDHDVLVDDSPRVAEDGIRNHTHVLLVNRRYNENVSGLDSRFVKRVSGVTAASEVLTDPGYVEEVRPL